MIIADNWKDYELLDTGYGEKLERWGKVVLRRPDPQAIWPPKLSQDEWDKADAIYQRSQTGGGGWRFEQNIPERWPVFYENKADRLGFYVKMMGFKHTGLFPEQAVNWNYIIEKIKNAKRSISVLNLFAYTGGATIAAAYAGAEVCHVDSSKGMVNWAKENIVLNGLSDRKVRFIVDDVVKFVKREIRRGKRYDCIIMDPPSYGRGPEGEKWEIETELFALVENCCELLSDEPLFFLVNGYTTGLSSTILTNVLKMSSVMRFGGKVTNGEIGLSAFASKLVLPCGTFARWER